MPRSSEPSDYDFEEAAELLGALAYFPQGAKTGVEYILASMVDDREKLHWLVTTMLNRVGVWHGTEELRGVYCTRFRPADGIEANCKVTLGFTALDSEAAYQAEFQNSRVSELEAPRMNAGLMRLE